MGPDDVKQELARNLEKAEQYYDMLQILTIDYQLEEEKICPIIAVDFSDVFRFLHPKLDRCQLTDWDLYKVEQIALHILFNVYKGKLVLLHPYILEFKDHMSNIERFYQRLRKAKTNEEIVKIFSEPAEMRATDADIKKLFSSFAALVDPNNRDEDLVSAVNTFKDLYDQHRIVSVGMLKDIDSRVPRGREAEGYFKLMMDLLEKRPERLVPNERDAEAAIMVKDLSQRNIAKGKYFVLMSSTRLIRDALSRISFEAATSRGQVSVPILRDLSYVILRYLFWGKERTEAVRQINVFRSKLRKYIDVVNALDREVGERQFELASEASDIYSRLVDEIWDLRLLDKLGPEATVFSRISSLDDWREKVALTAKWIDQLSKEPSEIRLKTEEVVNTLAEQTTKLNDIFAELMGTGA